MDHTECRAIAHCNAASSAKDCFNCTSPLRASEKSSGDGAAAPETAEARHLSAPQPNNYLLFAFAILFCTEAVETSQAMTIILWAVNFPTNTQPTVPH
jgi:hypothetical protein